ncbi:DHA2 family efflux MFS transporter permease subunit [Paludisphaera borealis]|uniref:Multidrug export protein EmrB n=1 Tax=Paludisphaera borealis TaxID=1387353 RepID=A0A1U7CSG4_9BACT|nr:DHA2 family efflux MFS transporter permease subunit [Paludisphaera borealis]APW61813.1 Multidrug export protein EmrB [Paludisphaera borealis]
MDEPGRPTPTLRAVNPWLIAVAVTVPTFMEVLDTSIANVALRYIAGGLSAASNDSEWVITSYLAANAIVLPLSGWLSTFFGRRRYFLLSVAGFTISSLLCGLATNLESLILFRILQGLAGGGLQPCTQGVLLDSFPKEKQGAAMTVFAIATLIAPILGPTLGGWITDNYTWRWIFFINVPTGLLALAMCAAVLEDPPYLKAQRAEFLRKPIRFDTIGLGLIIIGLASLEIVLSKGQEWDWFGDPFHRVHLLVAGVVGGLSLAVWWELRVESPVVDFRPLADRNFAACAVIIFCAYGVLFGSTTTLPGMLQTLFGYDAVHAGLVLSPAGFFSLMMLPVVVGLLSRGVDARALILVGALVMATGCYWMSQLNLFISPWQVVWPRVVQIVGLSILFTPLNVAAYASLDPRLRGAAVGLFALLRNEGGSVGTSIAKTLRDRREQFHVERLGEWLDPLNPNLADAFGELRTTFYGMTGDPAGATVMAWQRVSDVRNREALSLAYFDCFWAFAVLALTLVPLVFLMKRAVAEKGAHLAAE